MQSSVFCPQISNTAVRSYVSHNFCKPETEHCTLDRDTPALKTGKSGATCEAIGKKKSNNSNIQQQLPWQRLLP